MNSSQNYLSNSQEYLSNAQQFLTILNTIILLGMLLSSYFLFKHLKRSRIIKLIMDCEELLSIDVDSIDIRKKERLAALILGGQSKQYLGKNVSAEELDNYTAEEINKLFNRYEARLGASMTKTIGTAAIQLYSLAVSKVLPIQPVNIPKLTMDLESDPFVSHAINTAACELYYRFGFYMAPLTAAMTTIKYCDQQIEGIPNDNNIDGERGADERGDTDERGAHPNSDG